MPIPRDFAVTPTKAKKIKMAVGCSCELCGDPFALPDLELHYIQGRKTIALNDIAKLAKRILILCSRCHRDIHSFRCSVGEQIELVRQRPKKMNKAVLKILGYRPKLYIAPDTPDIDRIHDDVAHAHWGWGT